MRLHTKPENRADMVSAISERLGIPAVYLRMPTYAYTVGPVTVNRDGTIDCDDSEALSAIRPLLDGNGWLTEQDEEPESDVPDAPASPAATGSEDDSGGNIDVYRINIPMENYTAGSIRSLIRILYSRQVILNRMLWHEILFVDDELITLLQDTQTDSPADLEALLRKECELGMLKGIEITDGQATFLLPYDDSRPMSWADYSALATAIVRQAQAVTHAKAARIEPTVENEKYIANAWLNRLGFGGPEHKVLRSRLMAHLRGYAAFKDAGRMQAHRNRQSAARSARPDSEAREENDDREEAENEHPVP